MGLENPTYINDLIESNPVGPTDFRSEGDDHIRNMKGAIKRTFPGMGGRAWRGVSRSQSGALSITDNMTLQKCAAGITLTPDAAATLGNGFMCLVRAGDGAVTIDPGQNINGAGTLVVPAGYTCLLSCDGTEFFGILMFHAVPEIVPPFASGTKMLFQQTSPPAGWTKQVSAPYNDAALRVTTGTVASGGTDAFTTHFGASKATAGTTLTIGQMPAHTHPLNGNVLSGSGPIEDSGGQNPITGVALSTGGGGSHAHDLNNFNIKYVDIVVAAKD